MCWGRQAECACVRVSGVWLRVPDAGPRGLTRSPPSPTSPPTAVFQGRSLALAGWGSLVPQAVFSLSPFLVLAQGKCACAHAHTEGSFSAHPRTSRLPPHHLSPPPPPPLAAQARHFRGGPGGGDGRRGRPTLDPSNSVTTSLLGGNVLALCSLSPARPLSPRTLASSQPECVCGGESAPPAKAQAP